MKKLLAASAALIAAVAVTGCSSDDEPVETSGAKEVSTLSSRVQEEIEAPLAPEEVMSDELSEQGVFILPGQASQYAEAICTGAENDLRAHELLRIAVESWDAYDADEHEKMITASIDTHCPQFNYVWKR